LIGQQLSHFEITAKIGEGGMGEVYRATDTKLGREVALKALPAEMASDPERLDRFQREARALAALDHPNIVTVYSVEEADGIHFLTMGLVAGETLDKLIPDDGLAPQRFFELAVQITDALGAAHAKGITHRDLKPANVMVTDDGRVKVLDFGLAKLAQANVPPELTQMPTEAMTQAGMLLGTLTYMSPEQIEGRPADSRSDVFAIGILLYEMATGRRPFEGETTISVMSSILRDPPPPLGDLSNDAPEALEGILGRCLEKDPDDRFADASELRDELSALKRQIDSGASVAVDLSLLQSTAEPEGTGASPPPAGRRRLGPTLLGVLAIGLLAILGSWYQQRTARTRWAVDEALPRLEGIIDEIQGLQEGPEAWQAYELALGIETVIPGDARLEKLWPKFTREIEITSEPNGARVFTKHYANVEGEWQELGVTPLEGVPFPRGISRLRIELPEHRSVHDVVWNLGFFASDLNYTLHPSGTLPEEMVFVPKGTSALLIPGLDHLDPEPTGDFLIDRYEATNAQYKEFVDAGGYENQAYWAEPFVEDGRAIPRAEAMRLFTDTTGRPGPASWEVGDYPRDTAELPVAGVSWYEAAAFAKWANKSLPTIFHWNRVAFTPAAYQIVPLSNLSGSRLRPVASTASMNRFGAYDLSGNVREWTWNENGREGERFILGGGWNDPRYAFVDAYGQSAWDRSPTNGFRCVRRLDSKDSPERLTRLIEIPFRDFRSESPVSDEVFEHYLQQFAYDKTPLETTVEEEIEEADYTRQRITFNAAYGGERMMAYLFVPKSGAPPYQTVVLFPGSGAIQQRSSKTLNLGRVDFLVKSGRAVLQPIYKGTFERGGELTSDYPTESTFWKDYVIMWGKDLARSVDYLETRSDVDSDRLAYFGLSWGAAMGNMMPAIETRLKANVLYVAGLNFQRALPEVDQINYVSRVKQPTLMLNGELDFFFPEETSQKPMFDLLGTPEEHKKRLVYPGGHSVPRTEMIRESLAWLDEYLGPVRVPQDN
jgi:dienelactone hydrolase